MTPHNNEPQPQRPTSDLIEALEQKTPLMSGGFNNLIEFQQLRARGESSLPELIRSLETPGWWNLELIWTIAYDIGKTIEFDSEQSGRHDKVLEAVLVWADENGYIQTNE